MTNQGGSKLLNDVNGSLQSCITDKNITVYAPSKNFRCIISGPFECGKRLFLKNLIIPDIQFDRLYIVHPTGNQYDELKYIVKDIVFIKDIKDLPHPDKLPKDIKKLMLFDDVIAKEPIINEYFGRARRENCDMIYHKQNIFSTDRQKVIENCNLFNFFEQRGRALSAIYFDHFTRSQLSYNDFSFICEKVWVEPYDYIVIDKSKNRFDCGKLRINWDWGWRVIYFNYIYD